MGILKLLPLFALVYLPGTLAVWTLQNMGTAFIPSNYINANDREFVYDGGAANGMAYDPTNSFVYVGGDRFIQVVDFARFTEPDIVDKRKTAAPIADVAQCGYLVAWVTRGAKITDPGTLHVWDLYKRVSKKWNLLCTGEVGADPVSLKFFHNCETIVVANRGRPMEDVAAGTFVNPEGTISIVRIVNRDAPQQQQPGGPPNQGPQGPGQRPGQRPSWPTTQGNCAAQLGYKMTIMNLNFQRFTGLNASNVQQYFPGFRLPYDGSLDRSAPTTFSQLVEPTYVTGDPTYNDTAYVSLRENNAIVQINLTPGREGITGLNSLDLKRWDGYNLDAAFPPASISFGRHNLYSFRQPNAIEPYEIWNRGWGGPETFIFTADEGATTKYALEGGRKFSDAVPISQIQNPPQGLQTGQIKNLEVSRTDGLRIPNNPASGYDYLSFFGGRGISMFRFNETNSRLQLFWDSGDEIARAVAEFYPAVFNSRSWTPDSQSHGPVKQKDQASPKRGSQCKSLAVGQVDQKTTLVFTGVDGPSVIGIFSVNSDIKTPKFESVYRKAPIDKTFSILMDSKQMGDVDPARLVFIPSSTTPDNSNYLLVMGKKSGTLSLYRILNQPRNIMLNRLRKEAQGNDAALPSRSVPAIVISLVFAALVRLM